MATIAHWLALLVAGVALPAPCEQPARHTTSPMLSSCGVSPTVVGTDLAMRVTTHADRCTIVFAVAMPRLLRFAVAPRVWSASPTYTVSETGIEIQGPPGTYDIANLDVCR